MWFKFKSDSPAEIERKAREQAAVEALTRGDILPRARHRIEHQLAQKTKLYSTDMSTKEFLLSEECDIEPLGQVMGTCFYTIENFPVPNFRSQENMMLAHGHMTARTNAVERMKKEAKLYGADGIVSVRIKMKEQPGFGGSLIEFTAIGTAVKVNGWEPEDLDKEPFTSELNGQEFWQLIHAGYRPVNIAFGICSYYINSDQWTLPLVRTGIFFSRANQEIEQWTEGMYTARDLAMSRMQKELEDSGSDGCVGMTVNCELREVEYERANLQYVDLLATFTAIGSSIKKMKRPHKEIKRKPLTVLNLASKSFVTLGDRLDELRGTVEEDDFMGAYD
jgi:uncharacterized protein YbjQ (UPF0145 family)